MLQLLAELYSSEPKAASADVIVFERRAAMTAKPCKHPKTRTSTHFGFSDPQLDLPVHDAGRDYPVRNVGKRVEATGTMAPALRSETPHRSDARQSPSMPSATSQRSLSAQPCLIVGVA